MRSQIRTSLIASALLFVVIIGSTSSGVAKTNDVHIGEWNGDTEAGAVGLNCKDGNCDQVGEFDQGDDIGLRDVRLTRYGVEGINWGRLRDVAGKYAFKYIKAEFDGDDDDEDDDDHHHNHGYPYGYPNMGYSGYNAFFNAPYDPGFANSQGGVWSTNDPGFAFAQPGYNQPVYQTSPYGTDWAMTASSTSSTSRTSSKPARGGGMPGLGDRVI